jgi:hypothetical protein
MCPTWCVMESTHIRDLFVINTMITTPEGTASAAAVTEGTASAAASTRYRASVAASERAPTHAGIATVKSRP